MAFNLRGVLFFPVIDLDTGDLGSYLIENDLSQEGTTHFDIREYDPFFSVA